ncbi:putative cytokinetic ring protein SteA [Dethiothermospora halolimnae]|uniref:putative cytokinetic ring protein SteA n=1 Tax=Dethiothermospora halolimnae TaxID=3114390 RepID=UPI003CCBB52F
MIIKGVLKKDKKTKNLISRLKSGDIALINHRDLDEIAAMSLIESKVKCVINTEKTISGKYPNRGPLLLLEANIPIFECNNKLIFDQVKEGDLVNLSGDKLIVDDNYFYKCKLLSKKDINKELNKAYLNMEIELDKFIENTLLYAKREKDLVIGKVDIPKINTRIKNKHVLVVVRGSNYKRDLGAIKMYIDEVKPVLIGVDGGADAILEFGYKPDIVIGDMDSVSNRCLKSAKEIIVHAYTDGYAPGLKRIKQLNLKTEVFSSPGTSEDIALLLAYSKNPDLIVAVGTHNSMIDFLEKGRKGMASTFLVRLKVGEKLIDAKGVSKLYKGNLKIKYMVGLGIAALLPIIIVSLMFPPMQELLKLIEIRFKLLLGT